MKTIMLTLLFTTLMVQCTPNPKVEVPLPPTHATEVHVKDHNFNAHCDWCGEVIEARRYGARIEHANGTAEDFNALECMVAFQQLHPDAGARYLVVDFIEGKKLIDIKDATFLRSKLRPSPGKLHLSALNKHNDRMIENVYRAYPGPFLTWEEVQVLVSKEAVVKPLPKYLKSMHYREEAL